jgi:hypothetical protein
MIKEQKKISQLQFIRNSAIMRGKGVASAAGRGLLLSGSPLAMITDTESQMQFDQAINEYNLDIDRNYALSGATNYRQQGAINSRLAAYQGYSNAFSTILNTGAQMSIAQGWGMPKTSGYGKSGFTREQRINQMNTFKAGRYGRL